ncbi:MAG: hypothetical protein L6Q38_16795, partial [Nitrospira sp.]|nr:hypothetical protein [Nitrospira sp.]
IRGWGGHLVLRELLQFPDGQIGSKWMRELPPPTDLPKTVAANVGETGNFTTESRSFLLSFEVRPAGTREDRGRLAVTFLPEDGERDACELQILPSERRAQFGPGSIQNFATGQKSLREGGNPQSGRDYAVEQIRGLDKAFTVRVLVKGDDKIGGSLIDAEIAGHRTLLSFRPELVVRKLAFRTEGAVVSDVRIAPFQARP